MPIKCNAVPLETDPVESACWYAAEAPASSVASASSYRCPENIFGVSVVEPERELVQVERQIFLADLMVSADNSALEQRPKAFNRVWVNDAANILAAGMTDHATRQSELIPAKSEQPIAAMLIGRDEINAFSVDCLAHKTIERRGVRVLDHLAHDIPLASNRADDGNLASGSDVACALAFVLVRFFPADKSLIHFDDAHKLAELRIGQTGTKPMADEPCRAVGTGTNHPMDLKCADALLAGQHQIENPEPDQQLIIRVLENRVDGNGEPVRRTLGFPAVGALPVEGSRLARVNLFIAASRATDILRPAPIAEIRLARILIGKHSVESRKGQLFNELRFVFCLIVLRHEPNITHPTLLVKRCIIAFLKG